MPSLPKHYKKAALIPFIVTLVAGFVLTMFHDGSGYESDLFTEDGWGDCFLDNCLFL